MDQRVPILCFTEVLDLAFGSLVSFSFGVFPGLMRHLSYVFFLILSSALRPERLFQSVHPNPK